MRKNTDQVFIPCLVFPNIGHALAVNHDHTRMGSVVPALPRSICSSVIESEYAQWPMPAGSGARSRPSRCTVISSRACRRRLDDLLSTDRSKRRVGECLMHAYHTFLYDSAVIPLMEQGSRKRAYRARSLSACQHSHAPRVGMKPTIHTPLSHQ